jgi:hypothetical protein
MQAKLVGRLHKTAEASPNFLRERIGDAEFNMIAQSAVLPAALPRFHGVDLVLYTSGVIGGEAEGAAG